MTVESTSFEETAVANAPAETEKRLTLGQYLASIRGDRRMTLRDVEEATKKEVSNAYLSQIENDRIQKPSPHILHALAELYGIDTLKLMEIAGYITASGVRGSSERHGRVATFAEHNLTPDEEAALVEYLQFIRSRKRADDKTG
jgi:transcriptional regulator with XRE-family HTH domain